MDMKVGQSTYMKTFNITYSKWKDVTRPIAFLKAGGTTLYVEALMNQKDLDVINVDTKIHSADPTCENACKTLHPSCEYNVVNNLSGPIVINDDWKIETERDLYEYNLYEEYR